MKKKFPARKFLIPVILLFASFKPLRAQDTLSLLNELEANKPVKEYITGAFKSSRVINSHSMEFIGKKVLDVRILHRFGAVSDGINELFGLDQASMRMGFDYGINRNLTVGVGRATLQKELDGFIKYRLLRQSVGPGASPLAIVLISGIAINSQKNLDKSKKATINSRTAYYYQCIFGRKFNKNFSLQLSPAMVHRNHVKEPDDNDVYALGLGGRMLLSKRVALVADYFYILNGMAGKEFTNSLSIGFDIETGGHVFQLHFSNSRGMNERAFITETINSWGKGEIMFGFNMSRVFNIGKRKHGLMN